ncbi:MAG: hypothetical protein ACJAV5_001933 [Vicingaceae bacterium]
MAISFDASAEKDNLKLYIDGSLDASFNITEALGITSSDLWIGDQANSPLPFTGQIASIAIWNVAHSTWKIMQNFASPIYEKDPSLLGFWQMQEGTGALVKDASNKSHDAQIVTALEWKPISNSIIVRAKFSSFISTDINKPKGITQAIANTDKTTSHTPLPASGRNGEATKFLNRVKNYQAQQVINKRLAVNEQIKKAQAEHANKLQEAHGEAVKTLNNSRFDQVWFISEGHIHYTNPQGNNTKFHIGLMTPTTFIVNAKDEWQDTGIVLNTGGITNSEVILNVKVSSGTWSTSPTVSNVTGAGSREVIAKEGYVLPGSPEGSLIGRIGNTVFYIGDEGQVPYGLAGKLELIVNGDLYNPKGDGYANYSGSITVELNFLHSVNAPIAYDLHIDQARNLVFWCGKEPDNYFAIRVVTTNGDINSFHTVSVNDDLKGSSIITSIAVDEINKIIYYLVGTDTIRSIDYEGNNPKIVLDIKGPSKSQLWQLELANDKLYWTNDYGIYRSSINQIAIDGTKFDASNPEMVISNYDAPYPIDLVVDKQTKKLYWVDKELCVIRRANTDGTEIEDLYAVEFPQRGLTLDMVTPGMGDKLKQEIYWTDRVEKINAKTPGIAHFWPLDEGEGNILSDVVNPNEKKILGLEKVNDDLPEHLDLKSFAIKLDDARSDVEIPSRYINNIGVSSYTISMWIKMDKIENATFFVANQSDKYKLIIFGVDENKKAFINVRDSDKYIEGNENSIKAAIRTITGKTNLTSNKWIHLAFRFDKVKKEQSIFVNGKLDVLETGHDVLNGKKMTGLIGGPGLFTGLRISYQALSHKSIKEVKNTHSPAELMKQFILGPKWSSNNFPPILSPPLASLEFDGICPSIILGTAKELGIAYNNFTIEFWFKMNTLTPKQSDSMGISIIGCGEGFDSLNLHVYESKISEHFISRLQGKTELKVGDWNHLAFTYQVGSIKGAKKVMKDKTRTLYLNGKKENSGTVGVLDISEDENAVICIGESQDADPFNGAISQLRIWKTVRTAEEIATNYRNYRESFVFRGPVDGSETPEQLFIPAEGGLNLLSKQKEEYEARLIAYRLKKKNQAIAAAKIQEAHANKIKDIDSKKGELERTQKEKDAEITAKKDSLVDERTENRNKLLQAKNDKSQKIEAANANAQQTRVDAQERADGIKAKANADAGKMKADATANRDAAKRERDKNKR